MDPLGDFLSIRIPASVLRYKHMYVTKPKNDMNIRMGEFMLKKYPVVWGDRGVYAYNES